ncbi:ABC transporter permease [Rubrivirga sp. IMCC45206]|uniref:ABC transporter permease n=1 Tax=Rubrivirga sp. IMCC45206 TaxID=3391614 RepID=UPI00398FAC86
MTAAVLALWRREIRVFARDRARVVGVLLQPILFWVVFGFGFAGSVTIPGSDADYLSYLLPGMVALTVLFTAIYSTLSVVEDRQSGVLQAVLVAPQPRAALVLGVVLGGTTLAVGQAALVAALAPVVGLVPGLGGALVALAAGVLLALTFCAFGFVMAWKLSSTRAYHALMNVVLIPVWLLSGAFFPEAGASGAVAVAMRLNPATYGVGLLRYGLEGLPPAIAGTSLSLATCAVVMVAVAALALVSAVVVSRRG